MTSQFRWKSGCRSIAAALVLLVFAVVRMAHGGVIVPMHLLTLTPQVTTTEPLSVRQGQSVNLHLRGTLLRNDLGIYLGRGIQASTTRRTDARGQQTVTRIKVSAQAALGRHQLVLIIGRKRYPQRVYVSVQKGRLPMQTMTGEVVQVRQVVSVTAVKPAVLSPGRDYLLLITGQGLRPGTRFNFGSGIHALSPSVSVNDKSLRIKVQVAAQASPGKRVVGFELPTTSNAMLATAPIKGRGPATVTVRQTLMGPQVVQVHQVVSITTVKPAVLNPGRDYQLLITGQGLQSGTRFNFGAGIRALSPSVSVNNKRLSIKVQVAAQAPPGKRVVGFELPTTSNAMLATAPIRGRGPATVTVKALSRQVSNPPTSLLSKSMATLTSVHPLRVRAGSRVVLVLTGQGLKPGLRVDYGPGFHMQPLRPLGDKRFAALTVIDSSTLLGRHLPHATQPGTRRVRVQARAALQVLPAAVAVSTVSTIVRRPENQMFGMRVESLYPARFESGKSYTVVANGMGFVTRMQLDLGRGITVERIEVINGHSARVHLHLADDTTPGMRFAHARTDSRQPWRPQPARVLVQRVFHLVRLPRPKWQAPNWVKMHIKGRIDLLWPRWYSGLATKPAPKNPVTGKPMGQAKIIKVGIRVPALKDNLLFTWRERNPGLAEKYEVRFYRGDKLVATRKVDKQLIASRHKYTLPRFLFPDPKLIATLSRMAPTATLQWLKDHRTGQWAISKAKLVTDMQVHLPAAGKSEPPRSDLTWEVVGLRRYFVTGIEPRVARQALRPVMLASRDSTGIAQAMQQISAGHAALGHMVTKIVERSERWPLDTTRGPTGMACSNVASSKLDALPIDNATATAVHTGERWQLQGSLNLKNSPWAADVQMMQWPYAKGHGHGQKFVATSWHFDNVFIDWGDGTVEPLTITMSGGRGRYQEGTTIDLNTAIGDLRGYQHAYAAVGNYTIRVYQLAEGDLQDSSAAGVSVLANPKGSLYATALHWDGTGGGAQHTSGVPRNFSHGQAVASRAYTVLCKTVQIEPRHDAATDGPLHLIAAKLRGFPEDPGNATPPAGIKVAPAPVTSPQHRLNLGGSPAADGSRQRVNLSSETLTINRHTANTRLYGSAGNIPAFSACDVVLTGGGYLYYYGQGEVRLNWYLNGKKIGSTRQPLAPSWPRSDKRLASKHPGAPLIRGSDLLLSPAIPLQPVGRYILNFDATVIYDASSLRELGALLSQALGSGNRQPDVKLARLLVAGMDGAPALGVLPPSGMPVPGGDPVAWLNAPLQRLASVPAHPVMLAATDGGRTWHVGPLAFSPGPVGINAVLRAAAAASRQIPRQPPTWVGSNRLPYRVFGAKQGTACIFHFPVKGGGSFRIGGLQDATTGKSHVSHHGNRWSGTGKLIIKLPGGDGGTRSLSVKITFHNWVLEDDGVTVRRGSFDILRPFDSPLSMPATRVTLMRLTGRAGDSVKLSLNAALDNPNILVAGSSKGPAPLRVRSVLSPDGDLYAAPLSLPTLGVYDSGFTLRKVQVVLDFSSTRGAACSGGKVWQGVAITSATLDAYTFQLKNSQSAQVDGWGIDGGGFCGKHNFTAYDSQVERGSIHWDGIDVSAARGGFTARYLGVRVHVPWLDVDLTAHSATTLVAGKGAGGGGRVKLNLHGDAPRHDYGAVSMDADGLQLDTLKGVGMAVKAQSTRFSFHTEGKDFATNVPVPGLYFGMNGKAYFEEKGGSIHVSLSGTKGRLSQGVVDLKGVDITATPATAQRLQFNFTGTLRISKALPAVDAPVSYRLDEVKPKTYLGSGPVTGSFEIHKPFPDAHPSTDTVIRPHYVGSQGGQVASADTVSPLLDFLVPRATAAAAQHMSYCGDIDLGLFGGPPVKGGFALGYKGSDDFWAAHADVSVHGMPLVPPFMSLYEIGGGLGYNIAIKSFAAGSSCAVTAKIDHTPVFDAHLVVGDPSQFVYGFDGHFTVKVSGSEAGALMQYKAWILKYDWSGKGDFWGHFQYMGGSFDGNLNGHYGFLDDEVYIEATHDAIAMHFGGGSWYIHAGTKPNPIKGHVLIINAAAWVGVGSGGLYAGAKAHLNVGAGNCDSLCARLIANALIEAKITPQPHISANGHLDVHAKGCAFGVCLGAGVGASVHIAALPAELAFALNLGSCPIGHLNIGLRILPSPKPSIGGGLCFW